MNTEKGFLFFYDWMPAFEALSAQDFKKLFIAMCRYQLDGTLPSDLSNKAKAIATFVFPQIERRKYMSEIGKMGAEALHSRKDSPKAGQSLATADAKGEAGGVAKAKEKVKDKSKTKSKSKSESKSESESESGQSSADSVGIAADSVGVNDALAEKEEGCSFLEEKKVAAGGEQIGQGMGKYSNVYLSTEEYLAICREIKNADAYIDRFSEKLKTRGYRYPDHFTAILEWWDRDKNFAGGGTSPVSDVEPSDGGSFDTDAFFEAAVRRSLGEDVFVAKSENRDEGSGEYG